MRPVTFGRTTSVITNSQQPVINVHTNIGLYNRDHAPVTDVVVLDIGTPRAPYSVAVLTGNKAFESWLRKQLQEDVDRWANHGGIKTELRNDSINPSDPFINKRRLPLDDLQRWIQARPNIPLIELNDDHLPENVVVTHINQEGTIDNLPQDSGAKLFNLHNPGMPNDYHVYSAFDGKLRVFGPGTTDGAFQLDGPYGIQNILNTAEKYRSRFEALPKGVSIEFHCVNSPLSNFAGVPFTRGFEQVRMLYTNDAGITFTSDAYCPNNAQISHTSKSGERFSRVQPTYLGDCFSVWIQDALNLDYADLNAVEKEPYNRPHERFSNNKMKVIPTQTPPRPAFMEKG